MTDQEMIKRLKDLVEELRCSTEEEAEPYGEDAIVLYAEPGKAVSLVEEGDAIDQIILDCGVSEFTLRFITEELMAVYPTRLSHRCADGSVFVSGPLYICRPVIGAEEDTCSDLTALDFCEAMAFVTTHTVFAKSKSELSGFLFEKED